MIDLIAILFNTSLEDEGAFCFANVGRSEDRSVRPSVGRPIVAERYLENNI